jgi:hypothetical protein
MLQVREDGLGWVERPLKVVGQVIPFSPAEALIADTLEAMKGEEPGHAAIPDSGS